MCIRDRPTLVSFAITTQKTSDIVSPEFKAAGHKVVVLSPKFGEDGLPEPKSLLETFDAVTKLLRTGKAVSCYTPGIGGIAEAVMKMCFGNMIGFVYEPEISVQDIFSKKYLSFVMELTDEQAIPDSCPAYDVTDLGETVTDRIIRLGNEELVLDDVLTAYEDKLESVFTCNIDQGADKYEAFEFKADKWAVPAVKTARPKVAIPAFPGTNCEYDSAKAVADAGAEPEIFVVKNLTPEAVSDSVEKFAELVKQSQMIFIPGGFSGGDEPDGSGKFITAFFRNQAVKDAVTDLLDNRGGLMCGICNGFQALIKLGLVPYGRIIDTDEHCPTLTFNTIGRHQSRIVKTRIASNKSPWLALTEPGEVYSVPVSHGEGRFIAEEKLIRELAANGQIATQYIDDHGAATEDIHFNPNNSAYAIEGITSPDGRVFGKMGHAERIGSGLYKNVPGNYDIRMFEAAVKYFKG